MTKEDAIIKRKRGKDANIDTGLETEDSRRNPLDSSLSMERAFAFLAISMR